LREDLIAVGSSLRPESFFFLTGSAEIPKRIKGIRRPLEKLCALQADFAPFAGDLLEGDLDRTNFPATAARLAEKALRFAFSGRSDGVFLPMVRMTYRDTSWMMTVGGYFGSSLQKSRLMLALKKNCGFLRPLRENEVYNIAQFNVTDAERRLLDRAALAPKRRRSERLALRRLGFPDELVEQYAELVRFIPRYFESVL